MQTHEHRSVSSNDHLPEIIGNANAQKRVGAEGEQATLVVGQEIDGRDNGPSDRRWALDSFDFMAVLGKGNAAEVMLAERKATKELYALKIQKKDLLVENDDVGSAGTEKSILRCVTSKGHPFIAKLYAIFQTETRLYFVLEYISGGDLLFHIQRDEFGPGRSQFYAAEVCLALKFLHENGILSRDLKLDDVLLAADGHIKLVDFGHCKEGIWYGSTTTTFCGNMEFMAPEFKGTDEDAVYEAILHDNPTHPSHSPKAAVDITQKLLARDPGLRLGSGPSDAQEVMHHAYFEGVDRDDLYHKRVPAQYIPVLESKRDISNFDPELTSVAPSMTPVDSGAKVLRRAMQEAFRGFSYVAGDASATLPS
ncbi:Serine/threonine kinase [Xylographa pallens]|nr:Serine/threonine kinase [Xylographa pallens]